MDATNIKPRARLFIRGIVGLILIVGATLSPLGCGVGYVMRSAYFQAELLNAREPIEKLKAEQHFSPRDLAALDRIADVKRYGAEIGLKATDNYDTVAAGWDRKIWNLSASRPLAFEAKKWTFPIVGRIPYLGFFRKQDADPWIRRLEADGYETYIRTAGAYSTLGWFKDPVLPGMLKWNDYRLADTVLHELAHATLWIKGSVKFNESFASFVGEVAAFEYLLTRLGPDSPVLMRAREDRADLKRWRAVLRELYRDLDTVYKDTTKSPEEKYRLRKAHFDALSARVADAGLLHSKRFQRAAETGVWNNARLIQYKTYNHKRDWFRAIYEREGSSLLAFMVAIDGITKGQKDPFKALEAAAKQASTAVTPPPK
jgi:predicted aminopeptidase